MSNESPLRELFIEELGQVHGGADEPTDNPTTSDDGPPTWRTRCVCENTGHPPVNPDGGGQPTNPPTGGDGRSLGFGPKFR